MKKKQWVMLRSKRGDSEFGVWGELAGLEFQIPNMVVVRLASGAAYFVPLDTVLYVKVFPEGHEDYGAKVML